MPAIRIVMPNGTTKSFREGTPKSVIRRAQAEMLAEMRGSGEYEDTSLDLPEPRAREVVVTQNAPALGDLSMIYETGKGLGRRSRRQA